jgi:hypothetical protein
MLDVELLGESDCWGPDRLPLDCVVRVVKFGIIFHGAPGNKKGPRSSMVHMLWL